MNIIEPLLQIRVYFIATIPIRITKLLGDRVVFKMVLIGLTWTSVLLQTAKFPIAIMGQELYIKFTRLIAYATHVHKGRLVKTIKLSAVQKGFFCKN